MKSKTVPGIIFIFAIALLFSCKQKKSEEKTKIPQTVYSVNAELDRLSKEIVANPQNADAYYLRSKLYIGEKNFKKAYADINQAVQLDSLKVDFLMLLADIQFANTMIPQAIQTFQKCIALNPKNIDAYLKLAELHLYIKKYKESIRYANEALKIDKHHGKSYFIKGFVFKENGDTAKAISSFQTCVEQEPDNYDAYMQLGILNGARKNTRAVQYYSNALRLKPKSIETLYARGLFYQDNLGYNKAMEDYSTILQIDPNYKDAHFNMGYIHLVYLKVYDQAIRHFTDAIQCDQYYVKAFYNRGLSYEYIGNATAAEADFKKALGIFPTYTLAIDGLKRLKN